jgi:hypothetical protein
MWTFTKNTIWMAWIGAAAVFAFQSTDPTLPEFVETAAEVGVTLTNISGEPSTDYIIQSTGNGAGFFDYDNDDDLDLVIANGSTLESYELGGDLVAALYENRDGRFIDVTFGAGLNATGWGQGVCVADYDNDGNRDFYLTAYGANLLYHNNGDGTFSETGEAAGVADDRWSTNCAFGDYDRDGDVDLYVANYVAFDPDEIPPRGESGDSQCLYVGRPVYCGPRGLDGEPDRLYRNNGDGTFSDVTAEANIQDPGHYGLGVVFTDLDNDGWLDIYVANDSVPNLLFHNMQNGKFEDVGLISGTSLGQTGTPQAGMGLGVADFDGDGLFDIFVTNFADDTNTLYQNVGDMLFFDVTSETGASRASRSHLGWGAGFADLDNDGWPDLFVSNGHVYPTVNDLDGDTRYRQPKEVYRNLGGGRFQEIAGELGEDLVIPKSSRGTAFGDYDNDGDIDVVAINMNEEPSLYRNDGSDQRHWIGFRLVGSASNRDAIGARVEIDVDGRMRVGEVRSGGSYLSHNDMRVHFGLGDAMRVEAIRVRWPNGNTESLDGVDADRYVTIREGTGQVDIR